MCNAVQVCVQCSVGVCVQCTAGVCVQCTAGVCAKLLRWSELELVKVVS